MAERRYEATLERRFAAPRLTVWGLVSDTNRWDRASGLTPGRYTFRDEGTRRVRVGTARELGFDIEWAEPPYQWIEGRFVHGERRFSKGPVARGGFQAKLDDVDGGTRVVATAYVGGEGALMPLIGPIMRHRFVRALAQYMDGLGEILALRREESPAEDGTVPAALVARALIAQSTYDAMTQGPRSPTSQGELSRRMARLAAKKLDASLVECLARLIGERPDEEVAQMRPFEIAERWRADRRDVLRLFLHATREGVVDLRWQINCPVCRVAAQVVGALADVTGNVHCGACNIDYGVDFARHVEAVFQCHPSIRRVETSVYCASSPAFLPHVMAQLSIEPGGERREPLDVAGGELHLRLLSGGRGTDVSLEPGAGLEVTVGQDGIHTRPAEPGGTLSLRSSAAATEVLMVERGGLDSTAALGSVVASFPDFLDLFATEAPATGVELSVAHLALLFSDLTGSTALYGQVGDARAFAIVQEHFQDMSAVVEANHGAVVKTMGDAVMASFASEADAVAAAIVMLRKCRDRHGRLGVGAKLGVGAGACLAVRANDRLDYFGTTVNLAARLQARADNGQLVVTRELAAAPEIAPLIAPFPRKPFRAALKGIAAEQELVAVDVCGE